MKRVHKNLSSIFYSRIISDVPHPERFFDPLRASAFGLHPIAYDGQGHSLELSCFLAKFLSTKNYANVRLESSDRAHHWLYLQDQGIYVDPAYKSLCILEEEDRFTPYAKFLYEKLPPIFVGNYGTYEKILQKLLEKKK